uniref:Uncharacterized protein n=2 Tax=unclassified bacterial viruses TaxID=12333 RepID=A0AAU7J7N2_9VIRU
MLPPGLLCVWPSCRFRTVGWASSAGGPGTNPSGRSQPVILALVRIVG